MIPIFEPYFIGNEKQYLNDCIDTSWISSQGEYILKFEKILSDYHGMRHAVVTSNCTTALHLSLKSIGIDQGDEVICPDLTFIAPANMAILSGAELILVDVHPETMTIDPSKLKEAITEKTKAIIIVHQFGHAAHMDEIMGLANEYNLKIIEDNAESIGAKYKGQLLGTFGDLSTYSFFGNKIITTGEGGAVLTNNDALAIKCRELRDHGMNHQKKYHHNDLGYNYRMTNMQAAIGLAQMEKLDEILMMRKRQMDWYYDELSKIEGISLRQFSEWCDPVHWLMTISLDEEYNRDNFISYMKDQGIDCRQMINPVHTAEHFKGLYTNNDLRNSTELSRQSAHLPSGLSLSNDDIKKISSKLLDFLSN